MRITAQKLIHVNLLMNTNECVATRYRAAVRAASEPTLSLLSINYENMQLGMGIYATKPCANIHIIVYQQNRPPCSFLLVRQQPLEEIPKR